MGVPPEGSECRAPCPQHYGQNATRPVALGVQGLHAVRAVEGSLDTEVFRTYVKHVRCRTLTPGAMVVPDNLRAHNAVVVQPASARRGVRLLYLPPLFARPGAHRAVLAEGEDRAGQHPGAYAGCFRDGLHGRLGLYHDFRCAGMVSQLRLCFMIIRKLL